MARVGPTHERMIMGRARGWAALAVAALLATGACAKSEDGADTPAPAGSEGQQVAQNAAADGPTCTLHAFGGHALDGKTATVGFSQSEKEANPFRIAETQSIKDEAKALGIANLRVTNAQSQFSKQISAVQQL